MQVYAGSVACVRGKNLIWLLSESDVLVSRIGEWVVGRVDGLRIVDYCLCLSGGMLLWRGPVGGLWALRMFLVRIFMVWVARLGSRGWRRLWRCCWI